jgi:hypothetical protein
MEFYSRAYGAIVPFSSAGGRRNFPDQWSGKKPKIPIGGVFTYFVLFAFCNF